MIESPPTGSHGCKCRRARHETKFIVLTGGPGGGKTAILEMARRYFCRHVVILPETARIIFSGGFPRLSAPFGRRAAQQAIYRVQCELEQMAAHERPAVVLCDRGTIDGLAIWPGPRREYFEELGTDLERELARYSAVIHIEVPSSRSMYHKNGIRRESLAEARAIDQRIKSVWSRHPRHMLVGAEKGFLHKAATAIELLRNEVPECCRTHLHQDLRALS